MSGKQRDVQLFAEVCRRMVKGEHLECAGLAEIVRLVGAMNPSGIRRYNPTEVLKSLSEMKV